MATSLQTWLLLLDDKHRRQLLTVRFKEPTARNVVGAVIEYEREGIDGGFVTIEELSKFYSGWWRAWRAKATPIIHILDEHSRDVNPEDIILKRVNVNIDLGEEAREFWRASISKALTEFVNQLPKSRRKVNVGEKPCTEIKITEEDFLKIATDITTAPTP